MHFSPLKAYTTFEISVRYRAVLRYIGWAFIHNACCQGVMWCLLILVFADNVVRDRRKARLKSTSGGEITMSPATASRWLFEFPVSVDAMCI